MPTLPGKIALITGAASGIGRATAFAMAAEGARLALCDRDAAGGRAVAEAIATAGTDCRFYPLDVAERAAVNATFERVLADFGGLDCAFNNAGIAGDDRLVADSTDEAWDRMIAVNLTGVWSCLRCEIAAMLPRGGGAIVNTASVAGLVGWRGAAAYSASKHGVIGLTRSAAIEYARQGIRVNAVCPGVIETAMSAGLAEDVSGVRDKLLRKHPVGRFGAAEEVARAVVWLCSDASTFTTGTTLTVDGGYTAR